MQVTVRIAKNNVPTVITRLPGIADEMTGKMANHIKDGAQGKAPVLTGHLRSQIRVEGGGATRMVISDTSGTGHREYAAYNEYGTRYMAAQPYMLPGFISGLAHLPAVLADGAAEVERAAAG